MKLYTDPTIRADWGPRPAGPPDRCFYCQGEVGEAHASNCEILRKAVVIRYTIDMVIEVPEYWDGERVEFHRNDSSFCSANDIEQLHEEENFQPNYCSICHRSSVKFLREASESDIENLRPRGMVFGGEQESINNTKEENTK